MDPIVATIIMRFVERLIVVLGACLAIYCGYKLFLAMPSRERGSGKFELPGGVSIHLSRVGPGVFFSLFGAIILAMSFLHGVRVEIPVAMNPQQIAEGSAGTPARATFSGISATTAAEPDASAIAAVSTDVARLNRAAGALDPSLDRYARGDIERSLRNARLALMRANWSTAEWGDQTAFAAWLQAGEPMPAPAAITGAVAVYRGSQ